MNISSPYKHLFNKYKMAFCMVHNWFIPENSSPNTSKKEPKVAGKTYLIIF